MAALKQRIVDLLPDEHDYFCELCGIGPWDSFDHFLPKASFPEFVVLGRNLIPCCWKCNQLKGDIWADGSRSDVLNLYYDDFPGEKYLEVILDYADPNGPAVLYKMLDAAPIGEAENDPSEASRPSQSVGTVQ